MKVQIIRKKKEEELQPQQPKGIGDAMKSSYKIWGMERRFEALSKFKMGFSVDKNGDVKQSSPDQLANQQMQFTMGHGELGEVYRIGPRNHRAWLRALSLWNGSIAKRGEKHPLTKTYGRLVWKIVWDFAPRSVALRHTDINTVQVPPEWYMPGSQGMMAWKQLPYANMDAPPAESSGFIDLNKDDGHKDGVSKSNGVT